MRGYGRPKHIEVIVRASWLYGVVGEFGKLYLISYASSLPG